MPRSGKTLIYFFYKNCESRGFPIDKLLECENKWFILSQNRGYFLLQKYIFNIRTHPRLLLQSHCRGDYIFPLNLKSCVWPRILFVGFYEPNPSV